MLIELDDEAFGPLTPFVSDDEITDVDWNGQALWIRGANGYRYKIDDVILDSRFIDTLCAKVANQVSKQFNPMNPLLEAETSRLRISIVHESIAVSGRSLCIRKSLPSLRISASSMIREATATRPILALLANAIQARLNVIIGGVPGVGKTELAKWITRFIPYNDRVITIEDSPEWHFRKLNPLHDCVSMRVNPKFSYGDAIRACLRQNASWIALSEARGNEALHLLEVWSTGTKGVTTIHADDVREIPERLVTMVGQSADAMRTERNVYTDVGLVILVRLVERNDGTRGRVIDQIGLPHIDKNGYKMHMVVETGQLVDRHPLPNWFIERLLQAGIENPFDNWLLNQQLEEELA